MIGVIPLPALMKSAFSGQRIGEAERSLHVAEEDDRPRLGLAG